MEKLNAIVKKWGNSFGIVLPKKLVEKERIKEGIEITITISPKNKTKVKDIFGILKGKIRRGTAELLKEVDEDFGKNE
ncbi:AbrB/MazE/SpoVT family DNA-binding domain-containing protein [Candidatus Pacearchaeota archaeon]|nr:AbrB/MazE/SpoVT family DNA-binding domain-containing protein [Candidatus Pacearchaeota archaeon]